MATHTAGTNANNSLTAITFLRGYGSIAPADLAAIANAIKDDDNPSHPIVPGSLPVGGPLYFPRRGFLRILKGDIVAVDAAGFPYIIPSNSITNGNWTFT